MPACNAVVRFTTLVRWRTQQRMKMNIVFSYPNDYGSEQDDADMNEFFEFDENSDPDTMRETAIGKIAEIAEEHGLKPMEPTDFGHEFTGTSGQVAAAKAAMPSWVSNDDSEEIDHDEA